MSLEMVLELLTGLGEDVSVDVEDDFIEVVVEDFEGFDEDYEEILRPYDEEALDEVLKQLKAAALSFEDDMYLSYRFDGFEVQVGYASFEI
jgi:hypothetical protein